MSNLKWPSREEWARQRRAMYYDDIPAVSDEFADYASPDEIAAILAELKAHRRTVPPGPSCERSGVNAAIRAVKAGQLPFPGECHGCKHIFAALRARHDAARAAAIEAKRQEIEQTPVDDNAWQDELARRARIEAWERRGPIIE